MPEPSVWGPAIWKTIHFVALAYPTEPTQEDMDTYKTFYLTLGKVLPCQKCRQNFNQHLQDFPIEPALQNTNTLFEWTVRVHNSVNRMGGKRLIDVEYAKELYLGDAKNLVGTTSNPQRNETILVYTLISLAILLTIVLVVILAMRIFAARRRGV